MPARLSAAEIEAALESVPDWALKDDGIVRTFTLGNFVEAVEFLNQVTEIAEDADHHPDVDIRWNKVTLRFSTHSKGGLTRTDFTVAGQIDLL